MYFVLWPVIRVNQEHRYDIKMPVKKNSTVPAIDSTKLSSTKYESWWSETQSPIVVVAEPSRVIPVEDNFRFAKSQIIQINVIHEHISGYPGSEVCSSSDINFAFHLICPTKS